MTVVSSDNFRHSLITVNEKGHRGSPQLVALVDPDELASSLDVSIFAVSRLQWRIQSRSRCHRLGISSRIASHRQRLQSNRRPVVDVGLVSVFGSDLNCGEDSGVCGPGVVMDSKIAENEHDRDCNQKRPYLCDCARGHSQMAQLFRDKPCLPNCKPCASRLRPAHGDLRQHHRSTLILYKLSLLLPHILLAA